MEIIYCKGTWRDIPVYFELDNTSLYASADISLPVFEDRNGQMFMHEAKHSEIKDIRREEEKEQSSMYHDWEPRDEEWDPPA